MCHKELKIGSGLVLCKRSHTACAWTQSYALTHTHRYSILVFRHPIHLHWIIHKTLINQKKHFSGAMVCTLWHTNIIFVQSGHDLNRLDNQLYTYTLTTRHDKCWEMTTRFSADELISWSAHADTFWCQAREAAVRFSPCLLDPHVGPCPPKAA